jgi:hypothetical protein
MSDPQQVRGHVTVEQTGKGLKFQQLLAVLLIICGFVFMGITAGTMEKGAKPPASFGYGAGAIAIGFAWYLYARVMRWWHHG